jgi:sterol desaturase/sphingolipid hydroxylase (fatty acid hydroxylase superfamily)
MALPDLALLVILGAFALLLVLDRVRPGRPQRAIRLWRPRALAISVASFGVASTVPLVWDEWLAAHSLLDLSGLGIAGGFVIGVLVQQLVAYWWHRALHRVPSLWKWSHQMHHSAERIDVYGALYFHPLDIAGFTLVGSVALVLLTGIAPEAAVLASGLTTLLAFFQHANLKTPRWLGYIVQRPESHSVHHQRGLHTYNYADLPIFDMLFGTFRNPERFRGENGFYDGASARVPEMLIGRDVSVRPHDPAKDSGAYPMVAA